MGDGTLIDVVLFAMVAAFLFLRLRSVLGRRTGQERPRPNPFTRPAPEQPRPDARPDTGGLSGATPGEAVSWGKVDPDKLPGTVVVYGDSTIIAPLLTAYAMTRHDPRPLRRLYDRREAMLDRLRADFESKGGRD